MKYLLLSFSFFLFISSAHAQLAMATKVSFEKKVTASSYFDISFNLLSDEKKASNCQSASVSCNTTQANARKVANKSINCKPADCNPTNCKPENCPPGCKPGSPECKIKVASIVDASATPNK